MSCEIYANQPLNPATIRPNAWSLIACLQHLPGIPHTITKPRLVRRATTALTAMQFASSVAHAQSAPIVVAQAKEELGPDGKPKQPPKGPPPAANPPAPPPPAAKPPAPP